MTASLASHYALVGEISPSQPPHQKGLPPAAPHASPAPAPVMAKAPEAPKAAPAPKAPVVAKSAKPAMADVGSAVTKSTTTPALPVEPVIVQLNLPDVPAMGN
jgi:hypothetical protein